MNSLARSNFLILILASFSNCARTPAPEVDPPVPVEKVTPSPATSEAPPAPTANLAAIKEIDITRLFTLKTEEKALIYDVRLPLYHKLGHIDGAILFYPKPFDEAFEREKPRMKQALRDGKEIVLYCGAVHCNDSHVVAEMVAKRGIPVSVYSGGWDEWKVAGIE